MRLSKSAWAEIRRLYEETSMSIGEMGRKHGITPSSIVTRAKRESWQARPAGAPASLRIRKPGPTRTTKTSDEAGRLLTRKAKADVVTRLFRAISQKLQHMEDRMANGEERSAQDEERETRALATMIRNFERVTEAATDFDRARETGSTPAPVSRADAERMRREIAERVQRLAEEGNAGGNARSP